MDFQIEWKFWCSDITWVTKNICYSPLIIREAYASDSQLGELCFKLANGYCLTSYMDIIFSPDSLSDEQAKDLADWISIILGKEKVPVVKVWIF